MISESLYFSFAGRRSTDFKILNVQVQGGLYQENFFANRVLRETKVRGKDRPYLTEVDREPRSFTLSFAFEEKYDDELIREIEQWLDVDDYEPLFFSSDIDRVFYAMPIDSVSLIHNGLKQGYLTLHMRCDSYYSYSHEIITQWYDFTEEQTNVLELENHGTTSLQPTIEIVKIGNGDITISNYSNYSEELKLKNLSNDEKVIIDCENEELETSVPNKFIFDDFNDNYLILSYGNNVIEVKGKCYIRFIYQYKFSY